MSDSLNYMNIVKEKLCSNLKQIRENEINNLNYKILEEKQQEAESKYQATLNEHK